MKAIAVLILVTCFSVVIAYNRYKPVIKDTNVEKECMWENKMNDTDDKNDEKFACYHRCVLKKQGMINVRGEVNIEALNKRVAEFGTFENLNAEKVIDKCIQENKNADRCLEIYRAAKCMLNIYVKDYQDPMG